MTAWTTITEEDQRLRHRPYGSLTCSDMRAATAQEGPAAGARATSATISEHLELPAVEKSRGKAAACGPAAGPCPRTSGVPIHRGGAGGPTSARGEAYDESPETRKILRRGGPGARWMLQRVCALWDRLCALSMFSSNSMAGSDVAQ